MEIKLDNPVSVGDKTFESITIVEAKTAGEVGKINIMKLGKSDMDVDDMINMVAILAHVPKKVIAEQPLLWVTVTFNDSFDFLGLTTE